MALHCRQKITRQQLFTGVALLAVIGAILSPSCAATRHDDFCPAESMVYPYWSLCTNPAVYGDRLHILSGKLSEGGLISEYDEANATYYIRLTGDYSESGSLYTIDGGISSVGISVGSSVSFANLTWRNEGGESWFLVEGCSTTCDPAVFTIASAGDDVSLPCPRIYGARCEGYYLISTPGSYSSGLARSVEDGVTYITLGEEGTNGDLPIVFLRGLTDNGQREALRMVV